MFRMFNKIDLWRNDMYVKRDLNKLIMREIFHMITIRHKSHYASLEIADTASTEDIKAAYYKLSFKYHPDKNDGDKESATKFREIAEAYQILSNPDKKEVYDRELKVGQSYKNNGPSHEAPRGSKYQGQNVRTGRTSHFNYDEHYKMHYEEYVKQRQREHEYYKKWYENRKNANQEYYRRADSGTNSKIPIYRFSVAIVRIYTFGFVMWLFITLSMLSDSRSRYDRKSQIYYRTDSENGTKKKPPKEA